MSKLIQIWSLALAFTGISALLFNQAESKSSGAPVSNTGSPGDGASNTCAKFGCHVGTVNSGSGNVTVDLSGIPSSGYKPGETYTLSVTVVESGRTTFGFQATAEDASGNKMGTMVSSVDSKVQSNSWITHRMPNGSGTFTFDWTAPNSSLDVTFFAAGNAANSDGKAGGDHIYTGSASVSRDILSSTEPLTASYGINILTVFPEKILRIESDRRASLKLFNVNGMFIRDMDIQQGTSDISVQNLNTGVYLLTEPTSGYSKRIVIQ